MAKKSKRAAKPKRAVRRARGGRRAKPAKRPGAPKRASRRPKARAHAVPPASPPDLEMQFPHMAADHRWDREQHIRAAMAMGLTREEAERHADAEMHEDA